uniref:1-phosphatidylinositol 4-kinase n=1 Tax=Tetradesmus obliquus TaxID=3088 RepID=A0A383V936_TETOB
MGSLQLGLPRVVQMWASQLAELDPVPADKLDVLLRVCGGGSANEGDALQRALPLSRFLHKSEGKHTEQIVLQLVAALSELPEGWTAPQNGPLQVQADFTQLMLDLRRALRCPSIPKAAQQQLSSAVQQLLQALFATAAQQPLEQHSSWIKSSCNLLLRALTRSPQFISDPMLPLLPADALRLLSWLNATAMGTTAAATAAATAGSGAVAVRNGGSASSNGNMQHSRTADDDAARSSSSPFAAGEELAQQQQQYGAGKLLLRDDKVYLLLTKLIMTATGLSPEGAAAAAAARDAADADADGVATAASGYSTAAANGSALRSVAFSEPLAQPAAATSALAGNSGSSSSASISDPGLLIQLLEWSGTKVKLAMQQLLDAGGPTTVAAPSREATTACAQLAAALIHTLQAGPPLAGELEARLRRQVEQLLETALAVGEAAAASAAAASERDGDSDKVLALGGRILDAATPFVAAAMRRGSLEQQLDLTSRLQQLMLAAARLASRHGVIAGPAVATSSSGGSTGAGTAAAAAGRVAALGQIPEDVSLHPSHTRHHLHTHQHNHSSTRAAAAPQGARGVGSKLRAGMSRLAVRRAAGLKGSAGHLMLNPKPYRQQRITGGGSGRVLHAVSPGNRDSGYGWGGADDGLGLAEDLQSQLLVAEAEAVLSGEDLAHPWSWDVTQPLNMLSEGVKLSQLPLSCGIGGFLLARAAAEMLCEALAAAWAAGSAAPVRRLMLLPQGINSVKPERMVTALALGRLYVKLQADATLGQLLLPLLADVLCQGAMPSRSSSTGAGLSSSSGGGAASAAGAGAGSHSSSEDGVGGRWHQGLSAEVAGAVVCALEGMASTCVQQSSNTWLYDQALQLLLMMYREPTQLSLQLLAGRAAHPATAGLLADALHLLAVGMEDAPQRARQDLRLKLLLLFSDVAARVGGAGGVVTADLGDLLMAVAAAAEGLQPRTLRLLGSSSSSSSSSRMSMHDIQSAQREDASTTRLFRNLWLYTAMHKLVNPAAGITAFSDEPFAAAAAAGLPGKTGGVVAEWQLAAGRLAAVTPLLVVGTDSYIEADMVERLKVELGEQLSRAGSLGSSSSLSAALTSLLGGKAAVAAMASSSSSSSGALLLPQPAETVLLAFIVAVALAELSRAALAPLPDLDDDPVVSCPISVSLGYLKGVLPDGVAAAWIGVIVRRAAQLYMSRLLALAARQEQHEEFEGAAGSSDPAAPPASALSYAEQLACALIANLGGGPAAAPYTVEGSTTPGVAALADELLAQLLAAFPALYHSQACYCGLLVQLQQEEGDVPLGKVKPAHSGLAWDRTKAWVVAAAEVAPMTTEALLHSFLTSSESLPGATPPAWLAGQQQLELGALRGLDSAAAESTGDDFGTVFVGDGVMAPDALAATAAGHMGGHLGGSAAGAAADGSSGLGMSGSGQARFATQAAFRRAADLLQACGAARRRQQLGYAGDGAYEGALGLTRKLHYTGYVQGLMNGRGSAAAAAAMGHAGSSAIAAGGSGAAAVVRQHGTPSLHNLRGVDEEHEAAGNGSALAAEASRSSVSSIDSEASVQSEMAVAEEPDAFSYSQLGMRLVGALARAPLRHLTPETMRLSQFSWCWVSVESPEVLVPLISSLASAWIWTLDKRMGLFSGGQHQQQHGRPHASTSSAATGSSGAAAAGGAATAGEADEVAAGAAGGHVVEAEDDSAAEVVHDEGVLQAIYAHFLWLSHLLETWAVVSRLRDGRTAAARAVYGRLLAASLQDPAVLSHHPAAVGAYFRLLTLGLVYGRSCLGAAGSGPGRGQDVLLLFDRILRAALLWFRSPPRYFARCSRHTAQQQLAALEAFMAELGSLVALGAAGGIAWRQGGWPSYDCGCMPGAGHHAAQQQQQQQQQPHPVWGVAAPAVGSYVSLLRLLCSEELARLRVWVEPLKYADAAKTAPNVPWREYVSLAWQVDPCLALSLLDHFPASEPLRAALEAMVVKHAADTQVQALPKATLLLATAKAPNRQELLRYLAIWAPGNAAQGLQLLCGPAAEDPAVRSYAIKCLFNERPEKLVFFLPQLVQLLRGDHDGAIESFFLTAAAHSDLFSHQLIWALNSEAEPPEEAFNPEVKRSGWQPPKDTGLWDISARVKAQIEAQMTPQQKEYWAAEGGYFEQVTALSGYLYKFSKDERRAKLQEALAGFKPPRQDLYVPTNPEARVKGHIPLSGACMQSAAKVPILVAFDVKVPAPGSAPGAGPEVSAKMACIFKVGDDIRQDVLAIQVIKLLHGAFQAAGLGLYLRPYGCLPTGYECGIIEVVPNTKSRAALGELSDRGLHDIFSAEFGAAGSAAFERARENFIVSEAAYAVASYLLQAKDRHNGNIMLDDQGHIVHIDFGFILEISPGGNMGFESAAFKLSHEMTQVLDPGGSRVSPQLALFEELVVRAYLAARTVAEPIIATVSLMAESGLPCFSRGAPVANLRRRFHLEMSDAQAAAFMRSQIADAYDKWTTGFYDYIQSLQNKIPY